MTRGASGAPGCMFGCQLFAPPAALSIRCRSWLRYTSHALRLEQCPLEVERPSSGGQDDAQPGWRINGEHDTPGGATSFEQRLNGPQKLTRVRVAILECDPFEIGCQAEGLVGTAVEKHPRQAVVLRVSIGRGAANQAMSKPIQRTDPAHVARSPNATCVARGCVAVCGGVVAERKPGLRNGWPSRRYRQEEVRMPPTASSSTRTR